MELPGIFRGLGEKIFKAGSKVTIETPQDPKRAAALEVRSKGMLVRVYTDPLSLQSLGSMGLSMPDLHRAGEELMRMEADVGINTNVVPHLMSNLKTEMTKTADIIAGNREQALSIVAADRRAAVEQEALLEAQRQLNEKLKEEGLSRGYRVGATEMLKRIDDLLKKKVALPEASPAAK